MVKAFEVVSFGKDQKVVHTVKIDPPLDTTTSKPRGQQSRWSRLLWLLRIERGLLSRTDTDRFFIREVEA